MNSMDEEIKNSELERIMNEVNKNINDKPWRKEAADIISRGGGNLSSGVEIKDICRFFTEWGNKYVEFYGEYKEKARSIKELEPLINYLDKEGYHWI